MEILVIERKMDVFALLRILRRYPGTFDVMLRPREPSPVRCLVPAGRLAAVRPG